MGEATYSGVGGVTASVAVGDEKLMMHANFRSGVVLVPIADYAAAHAFMIECKRSRISDDIVIEAYLTGLMEGRVSVIPVPTEGE